jgi:hypothetical protein
VSAEAEHVHPLPEASQSGAFGEAQGSVGRLDELLGDGAVAPAVGDGVAGGDLFVACLAGVLGDVRCDLPGVQLAVVLGAGRVCRLRTRLTDAGASQCSSTAGPRLVADGPALTARAGDAPVDEVHEARRRQPAGRGRCRRTKEADKFGYLTCSLPPTPQLRMPGHA